MVEHSDPVFGPSVVPKRGRPHGSAGDDLAVVAELIALGAMIAIAIAANCTNGIPRGWAKLGFFAAFLALLLLPITTVRSLLRLRRSIGAESPPERPRRVPWLQAVILTVNVILVVLAIAAALLA